MIVFWNNFRCGLSVLKQNAVVIFNNIAINLLPISVLPDNVRLQVADLLAEQRYAKELAAHKKYRLTEEQLN